MNGEQTSVSTGAPFKRETIVILGEVFSELDSENEVIISAVAGGRHRGIISIQIGQNKISLNSERLVLAVQAALGKSFIGTTWKENSCKVTTEEIKQ